MTAKVLFEERVPKALEKSGDKAKEINAIFLFNISGNDGGIWTVDLKGTPPSVKVGEVGKADCTIQMANEDLDTILKDAGAAMQLYFKGKLKVSGNIMLATRLQNLFSLL